MANDSVVEQIVRSLSFEVEAVPQDNVVQVTTTSTSTPMNVKIRVRKKTEADLRQGMLSLPKPNRPDSIPDRIRLVSSDQTIMSFNVVVEAEFEKPIKKPRKTILGAFIPTICLGAQPVEDNYVYMPSTTYRANVNDESSSQSDHGLRSAFTLAKNEKNAVRTKSPKRNNFFGQCKPGGCLDPPFGQDQQPYIPAPFIVVDQQKKTPQQNEAKKIVTAPIKNRTNSIFGSKIINKKKKSKEESTDNNVIKIGSKTESILDFYQSESLQTSKTVSSSIMTYPPTLNSSDHQTQVEKQRGSRIYDDSLKTSFDVHSGSYFTIPKGTKNVLDKSSIFKTDDKINNRGTKEGTVKKKTEPTYKKDVPLVPLTDIESENKKVLRTLSSTDSVIDRGSEGYLMQLQNKKEKDQLVPTPKHIFTQIEQIQPKTTISETDSKPIKEQNMEPEILTTIIPASLLSGVVVKSTIDKSIDKDTDETKINDGIETLWSPTKINNSDMIRNSDIVNTQHIELKTTPKGKQEKQEDQKSQNLPKVENLGSSKTDIPIYERVAPKLMTETKSTKERKEDMITLSSPKLEESQSLKTDIPDIILWSKDQNYEKSKEQSSSVSDMVSKDPNAEKVKKVEREIYPREDLKNQQSDSSKELETQSDEMASPLFEAESANKNIVLTQNLNKSAIDTKNEKSEYDPKDLNTKLGSTGIFDTTVGKGNYSVEKKLYDYSNENIGSFKENQYETFKGVPDKNSAELERKYSAENPEEHTVDVQDGIHMKEELAITPILPITNKDHHQGSSLPIKLLEENIQIKSPDEDNFQSETNEHSIQVQAAHLSSPIENNVQKDSPRKEIIQLEPKNDFPVPSSLPVNLKNEDDAQRETTLPINAMGDNFQRTSKETNDLSHPKDDKFQIQSSSITKEPIIDSGQITIAHPVNPTGSNAVTKMKDDFHSHSIVSANSMDDTYNETETTLPFSSQGGKIQSGSKNNVFQTQSNIPVSSNKDNNQTKTARPVIPLDDTDVTKSGEDDFQTQLIFPPKEYIDQKETTLPEVPQDDIDVTISGEDDFQIQLMFPPKEYIDQTEITLPVIPQDETDEAKSVEDDFQAQSMFPSKDYIDQTETILPISLVEKKIEAELKEIDFQSVSKIDGFQTQSTDSVTPHKEIDQTGTLLSRQLGGESESRENNFQSESGGDDFHSQSLKVPVRSKEYFDQTEAVLPINNPEGKTKAESRVDSSLLGINDEHLQIYMYPVSPKENNEDLETVFPASSIRVETKLAEDDIHFESYEDDKFQAQSIHTIGDIHTTLDQDNRKSFDTVSTDLLDHTSFLETKFETANVSFDTTQTSTINIKDENNIPKYDDSNKDLFGNESERKDLQNYDETKTYPPKSPPINQGIESLVKSEIKNQITDQQTGAAKHITFGDDLKLSRDSDNTPISSPRQIKTNEDYEAQLDRKIFFGNLETDRNPHAKFTLTHAENIGSIPELETTKLAHIPTINFSKNFSLLQTPETNKGGIYQINIALQSYLGDNNEVIIRSFNADKEPIRFPNDTIRIIHSNLDIDNVLKIPIDLNNDLCIIIKQNDLSGAAHTLLTAMTDPLSEYKNESDPIKRNVIIADDIRKTLVAVYEEELLPLRSTIAELTVNIEMLKAFVKKQRPARIVPMYRKCSCMRR